MLCLPPAAGPCLDFNQAGYQQQYTRCSLSCRSIDICSQPLTISKTYGTSSHLWLRGFPTPGAILHTANLQTEHLSSY